MDLSKSIKAVALSHGMTLKAVAEKMPNKRNDGSIGLTYNSFINMIHGNVAVGTLEKIAQVIGCEVKDFFIEQSDISQLRCPDCGRVLHIKVV